MCIFCDNIHEFFCQEKKSLQKNIKSCYVGYSLEITEEIISKITSEIKENFILKSLPFFAVYHINDLYVKYGKDTDNFLKSWLHKELEIKREFISQSYYIHKNNLLLFGTYSGNPALVLLSQTQNNTPSIQLKRSALKGDFGKLQNFSRKIKINIQPFLQMK